MSAEATRHSLVESGLSACLCRCRCLLSQLVAGQGRAGQEREDNDRYSATTAVAVLCAVRCRAVPCVTSLLTFNVFVFGVTSDMLCATRPDLIPATNC